MLIVYIFYHTTIAREWEREKKDQKVDIEHIVLAASDLLSDD